jgi:two-component system, NarL family, invasion response regulator UvrY
MVAMNAQFLENKRILLIDDHPLVRSSLKLILQKIAGIQVIGEAGTGWLGIKLARELKPALVVLDFKLPDISGLEVTQRLLKIDPSLKILVLTAETHALAPSWVFAAGAHGYLSKAATPAEFQEALTSILDGQQVGNESVSSPAATSLFSDLTAREVEIVWMILRGNTTPAIAQQLHLDAKTIYSYRSIIFKKLNVKNTVALTLLAFSQGINPNS